MSNRKILRVIFIFGVVLGGTPWGMVLNGVFPGSFPTLTWSNCQF